MLRRLRSLVLDPHPLRTVAKTSVQIFDLGTYEQRVRLGAVKRPNYAYCMLNAALLARALGYKRISALEFGVAGGNGLLDMEFHAREISKRLGIEFEIYGFDTGEGLPEPVDYRDLPYHWKKGFYKMDVEDLQSRLKRAKLVLGDVRETSADFFAKYNPAPIGAISYDLDFHSSTVAALKMLDVEPVRYLPRVFCYFDDTVGSETELYNDYTGQRLAINEFNERYQHIKLGLPYHLLAKSVQEQWFRQLWITHFFQHPRYNDFVSNEIQQQPL